MNVQRRILIGAVVLLALTSGGFAIASGDPYAVRAEDPYSIGATVTPDGAGYVTVHVGITEKKSGTVVFAPSVKLPLNNSAEIFSDPKENEPRFHVRIGVDSAGSVTVTFTAFDHLLQRSRVVAARPE